MVSCQFTPPKSMILVFVCTGENFRSDCNPALTFLLFNAFYHPTKKDRTFQMPQIPAKNHPWRNENQNLFLFAQMS